MNLFANREARLIKGCKANERLAQEGLYKMYYAEMLRVCYRYLKSDELAAEALNASFLKIYQNIINFDGQKGELGAWIRKIMVRTCIDLSRKEARFSTESQNDEEADAVFILPEVLDKLYAEDLLKAIRRLPSATQLVFNLSVIEGYSHKEIGLQLQITDSTSRWHLSEAKKQLRVILEPTYSSFNKPTENQHKST